MFDENYLKEIFYIIKLSFNSVSNYSVSTEETNMHRHTDSAVKGLKNQVIDKELYKNSHCTKSKYK